MLIDINELLKAQKGALLKTEIKIPAQKIDNEIRIKKPIRGKAVLEKIDEGVKVKYKIEAILGLICFRCAEEFEKEIKLSFLTKYHLTPLAKKINFNEEQDNGFFYIPLDNKIDPWSAIRQEIILSLPMKILCKKSCRGICLKCGRNLNKNKCQCKK